jgi:MFS family permease
VIATALPQMAMTFGVAAVDLNIGISAYLLTVAVFIPASGWLTDRFGARTVFASAIATFTIASVACAVSASLPAFTAARILQGVGGAMMVPVGRLVVLRNTQKQDLVRAIAFLTWPALTAPVIGPPLGGFITTFGSWPWIFLLNVPLGIIGIALALMLIPNARGGATGPFDWRGFILTGFASFGLMYSLESIARNRIDWRMTAPLLAASICAGIYGLRHARRAAHPLLDLTPFALPSFSIGALRLASLTHADEPGATVGDFHLAFFAVALVGLIGVNEFRRLPVHAGEALRERPAPEKRS